MAARFPGLLDANRVRSVRTMWEFDDAVTAPLHGFAGADDYWTRASSKSWLAAIAQPTLVLNAKNDPFIPASSLAHPGEVSAAVTLEQPRDGGHVGFVVGRAPGRFDWLPRRLHAVLRRRRITDTGRLPDGPVSCRAHRHWTSPMQVAPEIFKAYDIRGIVGKSLTEPVVRAIGQALGTLARERRRDTIAIGRDGRLSGPALSTALADGIRAAGVDVVDIGMVTTPMSYFATHHLGTGCSTMVTGSHNPPDYNGLKMVIADRTLSGADIQDLREADRAR